MPFPSARFLGALASIACTVVVPWPVAVAEDDRRDDAAESTPPVAHGPRQLAFDTRYLLERPTRLDRRDRKNLYRLAGVTAALYLARHEIRGFAQRNRSASRDRFLEDARTLGNGTTGAVLAAGAYLTSFVTGNPREKETALLLLEAQAFSAFAAAGGSWVLAAERPSRGSSIHAFDTDGRGVSLDAALAAALVEPLRGQYLRVGDGDSAARRAWKRGLSGLLYAGAALAAYARVNRDSHWAPDAFLGTMAGLGVGRTLVEAHDEANRRRLGLRLGVTPDSVGASLTLELDPARAGPHLRR